jgi:hypothetical protein
LRKEARPSGDDNGGILLADIFKLRGAIGGDMVFSGGIVGGSYCLYLATVVPCTAVFSVELFAEIRSAVLMGLQFCRLTRSLEKRLDRQLRIIFVTTALIVDISR